jgi:hypothetical protein
MKFSDGYIDYYELYTEMKYLPICRTINVSYPPLRILHDDDFWSHASVLYPNIGLTVAVGVS